MVATEIGVLFVGHVALDTGAYIAVSKLHALLVRGFESLVSDRSFSRYSFPETDAKHTLKLDIFIHDLFHRMTWVISLRLFIELTPSALPRYNISTTV